jgi:hypothetical protein
VLLLLVVSVRLSPAAAAAAAAGGAAAASCSASPLQGEWVWELKATGESSLHLSNQTVHTEFQT